MSPGKPRNPGGGGPTGFDVPLPGMPGSQDQEPSTDDSSDDTPPGRPALPTTGKAGDELPKLGNPTSRFREAVYSFVTGREGATGASEGDVRAQLIAAFGSSKRDPARPDTAAAAKGLGVSARSVQRWVKQGGGISQKHRSSLDRRARQAMTTKRGRARALASAQRAGTADRPKGAKGRGIKVSGRQSAVSSVLDSYRPRETGVLVSDDDLAGLQQLWVEYGDQGAGAWLHQHYDAHYVSRWHFQDVDDLEWGDSHNY